MACATQTQEAKFSTCLGHFSGKQVVDHGRLIDQCPPGSSADCGWRALGGLVKHKGCFSRRHVAVRKQKSVSGEVKASYIAMREMRV